MVLLGSFSGVATAGAVWCGVLWSGRRAARKTSGPGQAYGSATGIGVLVGVVWRRPSSAYSSAYSSAVSRHGMMGAGAHPAHVISLPSQALQAM